MIATDSVNAFRRYIADELGFEPPKRLEPGQWAPFSTNGKAGNTAGRAKLFPDGEGGVVYDWRSGEQWIWQAKREHTRTEHEQKAWREKCDRARRDAQEERERAAARTKERSASIWAESSPARDDHPYLKRKGVKAHGLREYRGAFLLNGMKCDGALVVPARNAAGELVSLSFISPDGEKRYMSGPREPGCYYSIGKPDGVLCIVEGFATGASIYEATGRAVAVAFDAGNLEPTARALRAKFQDLPLILCADDDCAADGNPGLAKAASAARAVGGMVAVPEFGPRRPDGATDFNDLARLAGPGALVAALEAAQPPAKIIEAVEVQRSPANRSETVVGGWGDPEPLCLDYTAEPYPVAAFPGLMREAIQEAVDFIQCPPALAGCSALSVLSTAAQALADVQRVEALKGPISVFTLGFYDSGERKTATDNLFSAPIREWEVERAVAMEPELANHRARLATWEAARDGLLARIRKNSEKNLPSDNEQRELMDMEGDKPHSPRVPRMLMVDATPEALAFHLAKNWPSGAILSSEAGIVFGGQSMKPDSVMRNLAQFNVLWDGGAHRIDRRSSEGFILKDVRLTMGLALQPDTMRAFLEATKGLARGTGFAARFLVAWPASTQGTRKFKPAPKGFPAMGRYQRRIRELLEQQSDVPLTAQGGLSPALLTLSPEAQRVWIEFHDRTEAELRPGGDMEQTRDVASKAADNAARIAALFHVLEHGPAGAIGEAHMKAAAVITGWHLYEARRFLGDLALPVGTANAVKLEGWLLDRHRKTGLDWVRRQDVQHQGPNALRQGKALDEALTELENLQRARLVVEGKQKRIHLNPAILGEVRHVA